ncbi:hypothetical protein STCU_05913 [Strigomonas culicis]|nr:hypothetical protein STCU_05913 [Strigomonas culicis]|eukprot:EPY27116.1 hypothetical protein STCU_05913 [Strigomonas culicis]
MMLFAEVMVYGNFLLAIFTAPGYVPHEPWSRPPVFDGKEYSDNPFEVRQLDRQNKLRYCSLCEQFKPDNAHHCTMCGRCIYRMDHHCPWINNCVGRNNTKYFLLFVSYIPLGAFHIVLTTFFSAQFQLPSINLFALEGDPVQLLQLCFSMVFSLVMGFAFCAFASNFVWMAYRGETSMSRSIAAKLGPERAAEMNRLVREEQLYEVFGADRRWWRLAFPFPPVRDHRGLPGYTVAATSALLHTV